MPLQHVYRPKTFDEFFGNELQIKKLITVLERKEDVPQVYFIHGPSGIGKTTIARIMKDYFKVLGTDYMELNASDDRGIETIRAIRELAQYSPAFGKNKMFLFDESHQLTTQAQEAVLKLLEDPPPNVIIVLATTDPQQIKQTIKRRCHIVKLEPLADAEIEELLQIINENEKANIPNNVITEIAINSNGSPGIAVAIMDSIIDLTNVNDMLESIQGYSVEGEKQINELCQALMKGKPWKEVVSIIDSLNIDPETARYKILGYLTAVLKNSGNKKIAEIMGWFLDTFIYTKKTGLYLACFHALEE